MRSLYYIALALIVTAACAEEESAPTIDLADLNGRWTYQMGSFSGSGRSCRSLPSEAWAAAAAHLGDTTSYHIAVDRITLICALAGAAPDTFSLGIDDNFRLQFVSMRSNGDSTVSGCVLPGSVWAEEAGTMKALLQGGGCGEATAITATTFTFSPNLEIAFPDPNGTVYALPGTVTLTRR